MAIYCQKYAHLNQYYYFCICNFGLTFNHKEHQEHKQIIIILKYTIIKI